MEAMTYLMYYDRYTEATTSKAMYDSGVRHTILCHNNADKFQNVYGDIIETGEPKGIQNNFNYALDRAKPGEWLIFASDDYKQSYRIEKGNFIKTDLKFVIGELRRAMKAADKAGIKLIGLNSNGNALYVSKAISYNGLVDGRLFAIKKTDFRYIDIETIPDYYATAYHLLKYGRNMILNYCYADFERYAKKGLGSIKERSEQKKRDVQRLLALFPNTIFLKDKAGHGKGEHVVIRYRKRRK